MFKMSKIYISYPKEIYDRLYKYRLYRETLLSGKIYGIENANAFLYLLNLYVDILPRHKEIKDLFDNILGKDNYIITLKEPEDVSENTFKENFKKPIYRTTISLTSKINLDDIYNKANELTKANIIKDEKLTSKVPIISKNSYVTLTSHIWTKSYKLSDIISELNSVINEYNDNEFEDSGIIIYDILDLIINNYKKIKDIKNLYILKRK